MLKALTLLDALSKKDCYVVCRCMLLNRTNAIFNVVTMSLLTLKVVLVCTLSHWYK